METRADLRLRCTTCGNVEPEGARFCGACGAPLDAAVTLATLPPPSFPASAAAAPHRAGRPRGLAIAAALVLVAAALGAAAYFAFGRDSGTSTRAASEPRVVTETVRVISTTATASASPAPTPTPAAPTPAPTAPAAWRTRAVRGARFSYPSSWVVDTANAWKQSYYDTTLHAANDPNVKVRIDTTPGVSDTAAGSAAAVRAYFDNSSTYVELAFEPTVFAGLDAQRWEFLVRDSSAGPMLHKVDTFAVTARGDGVAVLVQAPTSSWARWLPTLERIRKGVTIA